MIGASTHGSHMPLSSVITDNASHFLVGGTSRILCGTQLKTLLFFLLATAFFWLNSVIALKCSVGMHSLDYFNN